MYRKLPNISYIHPIPVPIPSMYGIWHTYLHEWLIFMVRVGKCIIHGSHEKYIIPNSKSLPHPAGCLFTFFLAYYGKGRLGIHGSFGVG